MQAMNMEAEIEILKDKVFRIEEVLSWLLVEFDEKMVLVRELFSAQINSKKSMIPYEESICERLTSKASFKTKVIKRPLERTNYSPITPPTTHPGNSEQVLVTSSMPILPSNNARANPPSSLRLACGPTQHFCNSTDRMASSSSRHLHTHDDSQFNNGPVGMTSGFPRISNQNNYNGGSVLQNRPHTSQIVNGDWKSELIRRAAGEIGREPQAVNTSQTSLPETSSRGGMVFYRDTTANGTENTIKIPCTTVRDSSSPTGHNSETSSDTIRRRHTFPLQTQIPPTSSLNTTNMTLRDHLMQKATNGTNRSRSEVEIPAPCICDICGREFVNPGVLQHHKLSIHVRKNYTSTLKPPEWKCPLCHKHFSLNQKLKHLKVHGLKKYECSVCAIQFSKESELKAHKKIHPHPVAVAVEKSPQSEINLDTVKSSGTSENSHQEEQKPTEESNSDGSETRDGVKVQLLKSQNGGSGDFWIDL